MEWTCVHLTLLVLTCWSTVISVLAEEGYLVAYPLAFRPGVAEKLSVTIFDYNQPVFVEARIKWRNKTFANIGEMITGKGSLVVKVPDHVTGKAVLEICGNCQLGSQGFNFKNASDITILEKGTSVFIQTDKPIYKPEQVVLINLFTTGPDLRPKNVPMLVYILDPKGSRMIQWKNLKPTCCGIVNTSFPLSDQPVLGVWTILVDVQGHMYNKTFTVEKYVLPRFEVIIEPPGFVRGNKCSRAAVHARYTFGQPVKGKLSINMNLHGLGYFDDYVGRNMYLFMDINGTAYFDICINNLTNSPLKAHFRGTIRIEASVTSSDGNVFTAMDETCLVHQQLVSIEFTPETKKHFKPGLPYYGKLFVFYPDDTPASNVVVRINVDKNTDTVFREEYEAVDGEVSFSIPSLPDGDGLLWLDALVVAVDGKSVGSNYNRHYLSLGSWYSPSNCHLLMEAQPTLKVGTRASIKIESTCPCNFSLHYEIMSRGNIVTSGVSDVGRQERDVSQALEDLNGTLPHCETEISFMVTAAMSPTSRILVYYVRDDEEGVVDTMQIEVEPSFENKVSVTWSRNETTPKSHVNMLISAKPDSCVCVATVDKSVQLLRPGYQVTPEKVFAELAKYDLSEERYEDTFWWRSTFRRKRSPMWNAMRLRDADYAFREAGLRVMTDRVQLRFQDLSALHGDGTGVSTLDDGRKRSVQVTDKRRRAYFPETWIFNCFNISSTRRDNYIQLQVPDSITTWQTDVVALSQAHGMGVATTAPLVAFKEFFVEYTLPYSVIRGEQLRVPLTVFNYLDVCVKVRVTVQLQEGVKFLTQGGRGHTFDQCLQAKESLTTQIELVFNELGKKRIHAGAEALMTMSCDCSDDDVGLGDIPPTLLALDKVTNNILVEPEGIPRGYTYSVFFCPNERIHISTPNYDEYQFVHPPEDMDSFTFLCKATSNAKIALAREQTDQIDYEIVLGGIDNTQSWISKGRGGNRLQVTMTPNIVSWEEFRAFWISWNDGQILIGYGETKSNVSVILTLNDPLAVDMTVKYIGFATGSGSLGEFRIWKRKGNNEIYHEAFTLSLPLNFVPGSERAQATMIADVMGPTLNNLHNLIRLPFGCGEQNMIHFAPNVYIMSYLQRTNQLSPEIKNEATGYLIQGYQRQLTYKRHDGSYSAFGENDSSGSMWLTAFVLKSFAQSRSFIYIDPREMAQSRRWIISQKGDDGSFPPVGRVLNKDIQGGIQGKVSLTAYVVVALMEAGVESQEERNSIKEAQKFLEDNIHPDAITDPYTAALVAYALTLRRSDYAPTAERILSNMAIRKGGQTYWRLNDQPLESLPFFAHMGNIKQTVTSAEVEMTAYALLTYTLLGDIAYSLPIVKWLTQQRNSLGGFSSTQDTCVALQALSEYATLAYVGHVSLNVTLAYTNFITSVEEHFFLNNENSKVLQVMEIPAFTQTLFIGAVGEGCGLMQVDMSYNIPDPTTKQAFKLNVKMSETPSSPNERRRRRRRSLIATDNEATSYLAPDEDYKVSMEVCARWLHAGSSNMAVVEVSLLTGFSADIESLERLILDRQNKLKRYEINGRRVILYFDEISSQCMTCVTFDAWRNFVVGKMQPVPVKVYDYYEPHYEETRFYNVSSASPLARELCEEDHPDCNRVEDQSAPREEVPTITVTNSDDELCNTVFSNCHSPADQLRCGCQRSCQHEPGSAVCGSDGRMYENYCYMEVASCQNEMGIRAMPKDMCPEQEPVSSDSAREEHPTGDIHQPQKPEMTSPNDDNSNHQVITTTTTELAPVLQHLENNTISISNVTSESTSDFDSADSSVASSYSLLDEGRKIIGSADFVTSEDFGQEDIDDSYKDSELDLRTESTEDFIPEVTKIAPVMTDLKKQIGLDSGLDLEAGEDLIEEVNLSPKDQPPINDEHFLSDEGIHYQELPPVPSSSITPKTLPPQKTLSNLQPSATDPPHRTPLTSEPSENPSKPSRLIPDLPEEDQVLQGTMPAAVVAEVSATVRSRETPGDIPLAEDPALPLGESKVAQYKIVEPSSKSTGTDHGQTGETQVQTKNETLHKENSQDQPAPVGTKSDQFQGGIPLDESGALESPTDMVKEAVKSSHHLHHRHHHLTHHAPEPGSTVATGRRRKRDSH